MPNNIQKEIETVLFLAKHPMTLADIQKVVAYEPDQILNSIKELKEIYKDRGIQLSEIANGYQLTTRKEYAAVVERFVHSPMEVRLSPAALETLAIIAYRQPVSRAEIESIRGVNSDAVLKSLLDKELVEDLGKSDQLGKPMVYGTTPKFLEHFGLRSIEALTPLPGLEFKLPEPKAELTK
jgi:segregation and condensation protein B